MMAGPYAALVSGDTGKDAMGPVQQAHPERASDELR